MILEYIKVDNTREFIDLDIDLQVKEDWISLDSKNKVEFIKKFLWAFYNNQKIVLFDTNHKQLLNYYQNNNINKIKNIDTISDNHRVLFFTSGSSGFPIGAFKTRQNLEQEVLILKDLIKNYKVKRVVVSVPFVHIYGILTGLLLPWLLEDVTLIVKDDFLPYELLQEASKRDTLVITTPIFIKALNKLNEDKSLKSNLFISSTGPLHTDDVNTFEKKFQTDLMQLFGSTETGGIAYKFSSSSKWTPLKKVNISSKNDKLSVNSAFLSSHILNEQVVKLEHPFTTEDIINLNENGFDLLGRSNKLIKIAGKRISSAQIESILETIDGIEVAIVELVYKKELLRSEQIVITIQAKQKIKKQIIKNKINENFGVLTIPFNVNYVDKINYSAMGKKVLFNKN